MPLVNCLSENVATNATTGIPLISQGATSSPVFGTSVVAGGGTGNTAFTAHSVITAGTTSTGAFQNVSGLGSAGDILTSAGAGALPVWSAPSTGSGYIIFFQGFTASILDSTTYYLGPDFITTTATAQSLRIFIPAAGVITSVYGCVFVEDTLGSAGSTSLYVMVNSSSDTLVSNSIPMTSATNTFNGTALGKAVSAGDYIFIKFVTPAWATNPEEILISLSVLIK